MNDQYDGAPTKDDPSALLDELRDCLAHLHDYAYLMSHPFLAHFPALFGHDAAQAVREFRRTVSQSLERLRPASTIGAADPAWRPYRVLYHRYILGKELAAAEIELQLSARQIQREQQRGLAALVTILAEENERQLGSESAAAPTPQEAFPGAFYATGGQERFSASAHLDRALDSIQPLASSYGVTLCRHEGHAGDAELSGNAALFRQLIVGAISLAIRSAGVTHLSVEARLTEQGYTCALRTSAPLPDAASVVSWAIPPVLASLAQSQGAQLAFGRPEHGEPLLQVSWPVPHDHHTVVLVEDNKDLVSLFTLYLTGRGYHVAGLADGANAVHEILAIRPDVIVLDVVLQDVDGWELLRQIKAEPQLCQIPVAICSVLEEPELALASGAQAYLKKPVGPAQLLQCLAGLLDASRRG
jgi:CheY-like chemotaxis protein